MNWNLSRRFFIFLCAVFIPTSLFAANWQGELLNLQDIHNQAQYRLIRFYNKADDQSFNVNAVIFNKDDYQSKIVNESRKFFFFTRQRVYDTTKAHHALLGINGGFFTPDYKALGLLVMNGKRESKFSHSKLLSGLVLINKKGQVSIKRRNAAYSHAAYAIQAGPFLVRHSGSIASKRSTRLDRRTALALSTHQQLIVITTSPVTLHNLGLALSQYPNLFGIQKISVALNLDGGSSTAMTLFLPNQKPLVIPEVLPVHNVLLFSLK